MSSGPESPISSSSQSGSSSSISPPSKRDKKANNGFQEESEVDPSALFGEVTLEEAVREAERSGEKAIPLTTVGLNRPQIVRTLDDRLPDTLAFSPNLLVNEETPTFHCLTRLTKAGFLHSRIGAASQDLHYDVLGYGVSKPKEIEFYVSKDKEGFVTDVKRRQYGKQGELQVPTDTRLHLRTITVRETGITKRVYWMKDVRSGWESRVAYKEAEWPVGNKPAVWLVNGVSGPAPGSRLPIRMRPSLKAKVVEASKTRPLAEAVQETVGTTTSALLHMGPGDLVSERAVENQLLRDRKAQGFPRKAASGRRNFWNDDDISKAINNFNSAIFNTQLVSKPEDDQGWRIAIGDKGNLEDFLRCCVKGKSKKEFLAGTYFDTTFQPGSYYVSYFGFQDPLYHSKKQKPVFTIPLIVLHERKTSKDYRCMGQTLEEALVSMGVPMSDLENLSLHGLVTDGCKATDLGFNHTGIFRRSPRPNCELHLRDNMDTLIREFSLLQPLSGSILNAILGTEEEEERGGHRQRHTGLVDTPASLMLEAWGKLKTELVEEAGGIAYGPREAGEQRREQMGAFATRFESGILLRLLEHYSPEVRAPFFARSGGPVGRITSNPLEGYNPSIHKTLRCRPPVAEAIGCLSQLLQQQHGAKVKAALGQHLGSASTMVAMEYQSKYKLGAGEYHFMDRAGRLEWLRGTLYKSALHLERERGKVLSQPAEAFRCPCLGPETMLKACEEAADMVVSEAMEGLFVVKADKGTPVFVKRSAERRGQGVPLLCGTSDKGGCQFWKDSSNTLCKHTLAVADFLGPDFMAGYALQTSEYAQSKSAISRFPHLYAHSGRKGDPKRGKHTMDVQPPSNSVYRFKNQEELVTAAAFARDLGLYLPSAEEIQAFKSPKPHLYDPEQHYWHNEKPLEVSTFKDRKCHACGRKVSVPTTEAPGDLVVLHEERYRRPGQGPSFRMPAVCPLGSRMSGLWWEKAEPEMEKAAWPIAAPGIRVYHAYYACVAGRLPYADLSLLRIKESKSFGNFSPAHLAFLANMFGCLPEA